ERADLPSWRRSTDPTVVVRNRLRRDLAEEGADIDIDIVVRRGTPAEIILSAAKEHRADLIITGVSRSSLLDRVWFGSTVERLVRHSPAPLLVVRDRSFGPYHHVVVAT